MFSHFKDQIKNSPHLKHLLLCMIMHPQKARPRWWVRRLQFLYLKKARGAVIYRSVRKDLPPFNRFKLGKSSIVEDFSCLNNSVGDIIIGDHSRIGLGNTVIGPVTIGNEVNLAQHIVLSGLNHNYQNPDQYILSQGITTAPICIEDNVWIGANCVVLAGVKIGTHSVIAAGSVIVHSVPPYSVCAGNPAKIIKQFDFEKKEWVKVKTTE